MDQTSEAVGQSDMSSPVQLNSLEFPPLKSASRPDTLVMTTNTDKKITCSIRAFSNKRPIRYDEEQILVDSLSTSHNWSSDSVTSRSTSPVKKSRKFEYRDPPPVLQSLDSDSFKTLFESPTLSDSQSSESGLWSPSFTNNRASAKNACSENLGSLGDIIQKYNTATLNSIKGLDMFDSITSQISSGLDASQSTQNESTNKTELIMNATSNNATEVLTSSAAYFTSEMMTSTHVKKNDYGVKESSLMSISLSKSHVPVSEVTVDETSPLLLSKFKQSTKSESYEKSVESQAEYIKPKCTEVRKTQIKTNNFNSMSKVDNHNYDNSDDEDQNGSSELYEGDPEKYQKCRKHKNHLKFHPIPNLQVRDLPEEIRHEDSLTFFSCLSQLVVQITVHSTSKGRGSDDMYSSYIGTDKKRYGSGFIVYVDEVITSHRCKRENCPHAVSYEDFSSSFEDSGSMAPPGLNRSASSASTSYDRSISNISTASSSSSSSSGGRGLKHFFYGGVRIRTNKHVIFDRSEAENAYIQFFYNTPEGREVVHGHVAAISGVNSLQDHVVLHVMSHDKSLFTTLDLCLHDADTCYKQMLRSTEGIHPLLANNHSWVAIISHPHGLAKTITFGRVLSEIKQITRIIKYYDAATCPGSSGGLVITPSLLRLQWPGAVHSCTDPSTGYNMTFDSRFPDLDAKDMSRIHKTLLSQKHSHTEDIFKL